jgi:hypothetical protein
MTEWGFTVATQEIDCPKPSCLAKKGAFCRTPKGRQAQYPHPERMRQMTKAQWERCTGARQKLGASTGLAPLSDKEANT